MAFNGPLVAKSHCVKLKSVERDNVGAFGVFGDFCFFHDFFQSALGPKEE
jgi:hypothetical protein